MILQAPGIEGRKVIAVGEMYHAPLRRVVIAVRLDDPTLPAPLARRLAMKAINDTRGLDSVFPGPLVYGRFSLA